MSSGKASSAIEIDFLYPGLELDLFAAAHHWKRYWASKIQSFIRGDVLEVGSGTGSNTLLLANKSHRSWLCVEPDSKLATQAITALSNPPIPVDVTIGTILSLEASQKFDTILYLDVLEHISNDSIELLSATSHLRENGMLIILSPAHQNLFSAFDKSIGHFRRYSKSSLLKIIPSSLSLNKLVYLDSVGLLASTLNRLVLKKALPSKNDIAFWDNCMIPLSRWIDFFFNFQLGKSILGIWTHKPSIIK